MITLESNGTWRNLGILLLGIGQAAEFVPLLIPYAESIKILGGVLAGTGYVKNRIVTKLKADKKKGLKLV